MSEEKSAYNLWCVRCGDTFHEADIQREPSQYWTCPLCGTVQHMACRGPIAEDADVQALVQQNATLQEQLIAAVELNQIREEQLRDEMQRVAEAEALRKQAVEVAALRAVEIATLQGEAGAMRRALLRWKCPDCAGEGSRWVMLRQPEHDVDSLQAYVQCAACGGTGLYPTARAALQQKGGEG